MSKYSVEALSDAMRMELKPFGIDVVMIEPGAIQTAWGTIAADHLAESSRGTAYEQTAQRMAENMRKIYTEGRISHPSVVRRAICRAVNSRCPCARYRIGKWSTAIVFFHWLLPAKWWDAMMRMGGKIKV